MDLSSILKELHEELVHLNTSIRALELIMAGKAGRPPKWLAEVTTAGKKKPGRPPGKGEISKGGVNGQ